MYSHSTVIANHQSLIYQQSPSMMLDHPVITRGPMLRYVFLSVFALLLLTACGGNDLDKLKQSGFNKCAQCDLSEANLTGANLSRSFLWNADLTNANFGYADLTGANVTGVTGADFTGASTLPD